MPFVFAQEKISDVTLKSGKVQVYDSKIVTTDSILSFDKDNLDKVDSDVSKMKISFRNRGNLSITPYLYRVGNYVYTYDDGQGYRKYVYINPVWEDFTYPCEYEQCLEYEKPGKTGEIAMLNCLKFETVKTTCKGRRDLVSYFENKGIFTAFFPDNYDPIISSDNITITSNDTGYFSNSVITASYSCTDCSAGNTSWWSNPSRGTSYHWDFNVNNTNVYELGGSDKNLSCEGDCPIIVESPFGYAITMPNQTNMRRFHASDNGILGNFTTSNFSYSFWVNNNENLYQNTCNFGLCAMLVSKSNPSSSDGYSMFLSNSSTQMLFSAFVVGDTKKTIQFGFGIIKNVWYFITFTYDKNFIRAYVNGELNASLTSPTGNLNSSIYNLTIMGRENDAMNYYINFNGSIDEFYLFGYALTPQEVSELYNSTKPGRTQDTPRLLPEQTTTGDNWTFNIVGSSTDGTYAKASKSITISDCVENLQNTTPTIWQNMTTCSLYDLITQNRSYTTYDSNSCGFENITYNVTQVNSCSFCSSGSSLSICPEESKMWEFSIVAILLFVLGAYFYLAKNWDFKFFARERQDQQSVVKAFLVVIASWGLMILLRAASLLAEEHSASGNWITLLNTVYEVDLYVNYVLTGIMAVMLLYNLLLYAGVDLLKGKR